MRKSLYKNIMSKMSVFLGIPIILGIVVSSVFLGTGRRNLLERNDRILEMSAFQVENTLHLPEIELNQYRELKHGLNDIERFREDSSILFNQFEYVYRIECIDRDGIITESTPDNDGRIGLDISKYPIFSDSSAGLNKFIFSEIFYDSSAKKTAINIVWNCGDEYLMGYMNLDTLRSLIYQISGGGIELMLVDSAGKYIIHPNQSQVQQRKVDPNYIGLINGEIKNQSVVELNTKKKIIQYKEIESLGWYLLVYQDYDEVISPVIVTNIGFVAGLLILYAILLFLINRSFGKISGTVNKLIRVTDRIAEGKYDIDMGEIQYEEFNKLFSSFEMMAKKIDSRENEVISLNKSLDESYYQTITALARAIDAKDNYTGNHCERVRDLSVMLGIQLGLDKSTIHHLRYGSILHDIGKLGIGEAVLNKKARLTEEEFNVIRQHTVMGYDIISSISNMKISRDIILYHHERFDGRGYPHGLKGQQIPMLARIVAIADAYDAMTSVRSYRSVTMNEDEAIIELRACSGTQFDPELVEEFITALKNDAVNIS